MLRSSLLALLCIEEAALAPPVDGSRLSVVVAHLWGYLICHTCTRLPHQPHQSLSGNRDSDLKLWSRKGWLPERRFALPGSYSLFLRLPWFHSSVPRLTSRCFSVPQFAARVFLCFSSLLESLPPLWTLMEFCSPASCSASGF